MVTNLVWYSNKIALTLLGVFWFTSNPLLLNNRLIVMGEFIFWNTCGRGALCMKLPYKIYDTISNKYQINLLLLK